jgi:hypothetical protein
MGLSSEESSASNASFFRRLLGSKRKRCEPIAVVVYANIIVNYLRQGPLFRNALLNVGAVSSNEIGTLVSGPDVRD